MRHWARSSLALAKPKIHSQDLGPFLSPQRHAVMPMSPLSRPIDSYHGFVKSVLIHLTCVVNGVDVRVNQEAKGDNQEDGAVKIWW